MEGDFSHGVGDFSIFHEAFPNKAAAQVLCHKHTDSHIDPDYVFAVPTRFWLEGIGESVAPVQLIAKSLSHR